MARAFERSVSKATNFEQQRMGYVLVILFLLGTCATAVNPDPALAADGEVKAVANTGTSQPDVRKLLWRRTDTELALQRGGEIVWQFNFGPDRSKPFFHPIALPGMEALTWEAPPDHPWHHGLWFSWKLINGTNYWEENRKTGKSDGLTTCENVAVRQHDDFSARIELDLDYHLLDRPPVLTEKRIIQVTCPDADGQFHIDWAATFTAQGQRVVLDRTPLPSEPGGKSYGGYAGLSVRLTKSAASFEIVDSEQQIEKQAERLLFKARAVDYAGTVQDHAGGIAILDHPTNLNSPSSWYVIRNTKTPMTYFSPAVIQEGPHTVSAGESFTLRYRIVVHSGRFDAATLQQHHKEFVASTQQRQK